MGRPYKLTDEVRTRLLEAIRLGATYEDAANYAGIHYATLRRWLVAGESGDPDDDFCLLCEDIKKAEGEAVKGWLEKIERAAEEGQWQAMAWKLERRYPRRWGKQKEISLEDAMKIIASAIMAGDNEAIKTVRQIAMQAAQQPSA